MNQRSLVQAEKNPLGVTVLVLDSIFLALAAVALAIRITSRKIQGLQLCFNDYTALLAWPCAAGLVTTAISDGDGNPKVDVDPANITGIWKGYVAALVAWSAANTAIKVSIIHFYITIFGPNRSFRYIAYATMAFPVSFGIGNTLMAFLICRPFAKHWNPHIPGVCGSTIDALLATSIINLCIDLMIIILPIPMVWRLQMAARRKFLLTITFGLGFIVCLITSLRIVLGAQFQMHNSTYNLVKLAIVSDLEPLLGITIACLPLFPPVFKKVFGRKDEPKPRNVLSSSLARIRSRSTKHSPFRKFEDCYPLTDLDGSRTENQISGIGSHTNSLDDQGAKDEADEAYSPPTITVKQGWEVRSDQVL